MGAVFGYTGPPDDRLTQAMSAALRHRGPLDLHLASNGESTIGLRGPQQTRSLGVVSPALFESPDERLSVTLCGWVTGVDDRELARAARESSTRFYEALLRQYRLEGPQVVAKIRGAFLLVLRDGATLHLSRDGAGNRTLFYAQHSGRWCFGIEPKAITTLPGFSKRIRPAALAQYLACSFVPGSGTMLEGLYELQAGHTVTLAPQREPVVQRWFHFEREEPAESLQAVTNGAIDDRAVGEFRDQFAQAISERIPRGEPVGVFLSGGLDSSIVTAELARQIGGRNVRTWAIHFGPKYAHELEFARAVAERHGTRHEEVLIQPRRFAPRLRQMIWHLDDPIGDPITQPNFELAAHASEEVRYIFNGEGGDPCYGGPKNIPMMLQHWYGGVDRDPNFRERQYLQSYRRAWEEIDFLLNDNVRREIDIERDLDGVFRRYLQAPHPRMFLNRLTSINIREKGAHLIQPKVERMLAAHGITPLAPLFDERLIRLSFQLPPRYKLHQGIEKVILKRAYENDLPPEIIQRPKSGMRVPVHYWFRSEMRRYARRILSRSAVVRGGLFNPDRVSQLLAYNIEEGRGRYGLRLWMLITLELWRRIVVEGEAV